MGITLRGLIVAIVLLLASGDPAGAQQGDVAAPDPAVPVPEGGASQPDAPAGDPSLPAANGAASDQSVDLQAGELLKKLAAKQFDARLPEKPLSDWFAEQIGKRAQIEWTTGDCSGEGGDPDAGQNGDTGGSSAVGNGGMSNAPANSDIILCSEAQALFYDADGKPSLDRYVVLQLWIGSHRLGVNGDPRDYGPDALSIFVFDGVSTRTLNRLGELPGVLATIN
ncbi:MAG: hypothetical protein QOK29_1166 [Rhodospirillaceae bacterium]|jgi:hypothetical protein|nr:hypothetical protein [Rhodospirillaceae bacterium]